MAKKNILIIDDEKNFCLLVKKNLELLGDFEVSIATDGKAGIKMAKAMKPHLILLDILMPGMDGFKVLEELKKSGDTIGISVVMLTAKEDSEAKFRAARLYDEEYIVKPIEDTELKTIIEKVLDRRGVK
ncbi:MAG: response regulator [Candidatus Omnitrophota bacterium]|nr:response regulator [Candidatus Omnitrophota bacterium]